VEGILKIKRITEEERNILYSAVPCTVFTAHILISIVFDRAPPCSPGSTVPRQADDARCITIGRIYSHAHVHAEEAVLASPERYDCDSMRVQLLWCMPRELGIWTPDNDAGIVAIAAPRLVQRLQMLFFDQAPKGWSGGGARASAVAARGIHNASALNSGPKE
jgi:hypothetical protein